MRPASTFYIIKLSNFRAICSYHCKEDEVWIRNYLKKYGFVTDVSDGFICPDWTVEAYLEAELRRGIVFGKKEV